MYLNGLVSSGSEILADILSGVLIARIGVKMIFILSFAMSFAGMLALIVYSGDNVYYMAVFVLGTKFGVSCAFNTAYCANNLVFPVTIVATSYGVCNFFARLLTIAAPYVAEIDPKFVPKAIFCAIVGSAFLASWLLRTQDVKDTKVKEKYMK